MATVIDTLIVKLGLDPKDLSAKGQVSVKQLKELEGQTKKVETSGKEATKSLEDLTRGLGRMFAVLGGSYAIKSFITDTINQNAALDRLAKNLGTSVTTLSAWGNAVEEVGGSAKSVQGTFDMLSKAQTQIRLTGESSLIPFFARLGINLGAFGEKARPVEDILLDLSDKFSKMDQTQANNMGRMMGLDQDTLNLLLKGRQAVELMIKRQKEHNAVTKAEAEQDAKWQHEIVTLNQTLNKFGRDLLQSAAPALETLIGWLSKFGDWVHANQEFVTDFLKVMAVGLGVLAIATAPIDLTVAAVIALGAAIALLYQDYQTWKRGGNSFVDWQVWKDRVDAVTASLTKLRTVLQSLAPAAQADSKYTSKAEGIFDKTLNKLGLHDIPLSQLFGIKDQSGGPSKQAQAIGQIEGFNAKGSSPNRPQRNHNPGDIEYGDFARKNGATGTDGRFAIFPDDQTGYRALDALLKSKDYKDLTVAQAISKFAPPEENDTAKYIKDFTARTGLGANDPINGSAYGGIKGASSNVAQAAQPGASTTHSDNSTSVSTGDINIFTNKDDAPGIAGDFKGAVDYLFTSQANSGLT